MRDCVTLEQYLLRYGPLLAKQAQESVRPRHIPGIDPLEVAALLRPAFPAQQHLITGGVRTLRVEKSLLLVAEMGTGKTLMANGIVHSMAATVADLEAGGRPYRAIVMCPGHLPGKWKREIEETVPGARVQILAGWRDVVKLDPSTRPKGPEWYVIGRDTAKLSCSWRPATWTREVARDRRTWRDGLGKKHNHGVVSWTDGLKRCPRCGQVIMDPKEDVPISSETLHRKPLFCRGPRTKMVQQQVDGVWQLVEKTLDEGCGEALWTKEAKPLRWSPAHFIHKKLDGFFDVAVFDEIHEEKGDATAQAIALGEIAAASRKRIGLTGTLIGGYAWHIRSLMWRLFPDALVSEGLTWDDRMEFDEKFGRIQTTIIDKGGRDDDAGEANSQSRGSKGKTTRKDVKPGVMPRLFARLIKNCVFLSLADVADQLPELQEDVVAVDMTEAQADEYRRIEAALALEMKDMVRRGDKRLLGTMLSTLLSWPDYPFGWATVGYVDRDRSGGVRAFRGVVTPANLGEHDVYPKEQALLDVIRDEKRQGRQVWVYVQYTDTHDVLERLETLCLAEGFRTEVMRSSVPPKDREDWIIDHCQDVDVCISHPMLVETGVDLFDKGGNHNFCTLVFYETGYRLTTMRQASRRAWRIGQKQLCRVVYLYYKGTIQERAMEKMGDKLVAAQAIEGKFSAEGLAALVMGDDESAEMALARSIDSQLDSGAAMRNWEKVRATAGATRVITKEENDQALLQLFGGFAEGQPSLFEGLTSMIGFDAIDNPFALLATATE